MTINRSKDILKRMSGKKPTAKQMKRVNKIIDLLGVKEVSNYINNIKGYKNTDINNLDRRQAQKIITGLDAYLPRKPIFNIYGRDVF